MKKLSILFFLIPIVFTATAQDSSYSGSKGKNAKKEIRRKKVVPLESLDLTDAMEIAGNDPSVEEQVERSNGVEAL